MKQTQRTLPSCSNLFYRKWFTGSNKCLGITDNPLYPWRLIADNSDSEITTKEIFKFNQASKNDKNHLIIWLVFAFVVVILQGCSMAPLQLDRYSTIEETPERFIACHGYGCRLEALVELSSQEWHLIQSPLKQITTSPVQERAQIAQSIALIEQIVGQKTGTDKDVGGATIIGQGIYQMDCIDETINTSKYLNFLKSEGLINLHDIEIPARRGAFVDGAWPHNTAVIKERASGKRFAIDSWFADNGKVPYVVPLEIWLGGWRPNVQE